jgi:hypothetical protein
MDIKDQKKKNLALYLESHTSGTLLNRSLGSYESASNNFEGHSRRLADKSYKLPPLGQSPFTLYTGTIPDLHKRNSASKLDFSSCPETQL